VEWGYGAGDFDGAQGFGYRHVSSVADLREVLGV
jgi:hypothetical protein